jgi:hypothetical protein
MATENAAASAAELMTVYDDYTPPLPAGKYRFVLQQTVSVEGDPQRHYYRDQPLEILAPRYSIESDEIQAYFPPRGGTGNYQNNLPHLVLRSRSLPWERLPWPDAGSQSNKGREPWLVLLVLSEEEVLDGNAIVKTAQVSNLSPHETTPRRLCREDGKSILLPNITIDEDPNTPVRLLDLNLDLFLKLCPRRRDVPLLAHIRCVDTTSKVPLQMVADGEFSVLVANRFPSSGSNTIHLISLEGWKDLLDAPDAPIAQSLSASRIRTITLASWSFVCDSSGGDTFGGMMVRLRNNANVFSAAAAHSSDPYVNRTISYGYVPVDYQPLNSTATFAWYRGPLSPLVRQRLKQPPFQRADSALVFDDRTGIMDVSYASAWQLGRLLALASPSFSKGLRLFVEDSENAAEIAKQIATFLDLHRSAFNDLASVGKAPEAEKVAIADDLVRWLANLVMLYPVPFHYLVPHTALLPTESIRFFHLDDNWVDAMVDGALSIAVRSLGGQDVASRADLQSALSKIVYQHRLRLQGKSPEWNPTDSYMDIPKTGFLLRSNLVSDWPGVEVTATTGGVSPGVIPEILRLDQIADGVLFCLARGSLKQVRFREPREGITFGVGSEGTIKARKSGESINVRKNFLRSDGVINVAGVRDALARSEKITVGSAEFALQMIRRPEEQVIKWG